MVQPVDYGSVLRSGAALIPNLQEQLVQQAQLELQSRQLGVAERNAARLASQAQTEQARQVEYQAAVQQLGANPSSAALVNLMTRFPEFSEGLRRTFQSQDETRQRSDRNQLAQIAWAASRGDYNSALTTWRARIEADRRAGEEPDATEAAILADLESGDPARQREAAEAIGHYYASTGSNTNADLEALGYRQQLRNVGPGDDVIDERTGEVRYRSPVVRGPDNNIYPNPLANGQGVTPPAGNNATATGGWESFYNGFLAPAEGGYVASDGRSNAPANFGVNQRANPDINVRNLTREQAQRILHDRYWVPSGADRITNPGLQAIHADTAVNMGVGTARRYLQQSGGDPARYLQLRENRYRRLGGRELQGWLQRNRRLGQFAGVASAPVQIRSRQQYEALPRGTTYVDPNGVTRVRQ